MKPTTLAPEPGSFFGVDIEAIARYVAVGASASRVSGQESGAVCVFDAASGALVRRLECPRPGREDFFGRCVALHGGRIAVAAHRANVGVDKGGAVFLFQLDTGRLLHTWKNPLPRRNNSFATAVALTDDYILINDPSAPPGGVVYVFDLAAGKLLRTLRKPSPVENDEFGASLAAWGGRVVVGVPGDDSGGANAGAALVFDLSSGELAASLQSPTPQAGARLGHSVAVSETWLVVGAPGAKEKFPSSGQIEVFDTLTSAWRRTIKNPTPAAEDTFGRVVAVSSELLAVGVEFDDLNHQDAGVCHLFDLASGSLLHTIASPLPERGGRFGTQVSFRGDELLIGAPHANFAQGVSGGAYVYDATTATKQRELRNLVAATDGPSGTTQGDAVAIESNRIVVGLTSDSAAGPEAGAVHVFGLATKMPERSIVNPQPTGRPAYFGASIAVSGDTVAIGVPQAGRRNTGAVHLYNLDTGHVSRTIAAPNDFDGLFGTSLDLADAQLLVGAPHASLPPIGGSGVTRVMCGAAYVFDAKTGRLLHTFPTPQDSQFFGRAVAIDGKFAAVSSQTPRPTINVYDAATGQLLKTLAAPPLEPSGTFGQSISLDGSRCLSGVHLFDLESGQLIRTFANPSRNAQNALGHRVALSGRRALLTAPEEHLDGKFAGVSYVFDVDSGKMVQTLRSPTPQPGARFGQSAAIDRRFAAVGFTLFRLDSHE